jgi:prepilin-type N-terminal cleavage/methylation domain-containing protein
MDRPLPIRGQMLPVRVRPSERGFSLLELMMVVGISAVVAAIAIPMMSTTLGTYRIQGDARSLTNAVSLAKLRAASDFTKCRLLVDLDDKSFQVEVWDRVAGDWVDDRGPTTLSSYDESFSFSPIATAPDGTQSTIGQAPQCLDKDGMAIGNTACIVFNSRGIPVLDTAGNTGNPTNAYALYIADPTVVYAVTVSVTGVIQLWRSNPTATPIWQRQ